MSEFNFFHISNQGKISANASLVEAILAANQGGYVWADFYQPAAGDLKQLRDSFGLNPQALADWESSDLLDQIAHHPRSTYLRFNTLKHAGKLNTESSLLFVGEKFLITLSSQKNDPISPLTHAKLPETLGGGPAYLLYEILKDRISQTTAFIDQLAVMARQAEQQALEDPIQCDTAAAVKVRQELRLAQRQLAHQQAVLDKIVRKESPFIPEQAALLFQNLLNCCVSLQVKAEDASELLSGLVDQHLSAALRKANTANQILHTRIRQLSLTITVIMPVILLLAIFALAQWPMVAAGINWGYAVMIVIAGAALPGYLVYRILNRSKI